MLASGDPMFYGIGRALAEELGPSRCTCYPHPSSVSYACARLGWPVEDTEVVTLVGRPVARLAAALHDGRRVLVLSAGRRVRPTRSPLCCESGASARAGCGCWSSSASEREDAYEGRGRQLGPTRPATPSTWSPSTAAATRPTTRRASAPTPGLPDDAYEHDGQLTKRHVRAATLCRARPGPRRAAVGHRRRLRLHRHRVDAHAPLLPGGRGRARPGARRADHPQRRRALGVPGLRVVTGAAPEALAGLPAPDAVFIGGGLTAPGLLDACWAALPAGGRLVANTVTLESEAVLADRYRRHGGELVRLAVAHAVPVGGFTGWRQAMPVTQWSVTKPKSTEEKDQK